MSWQTCVLQMMDDLERSISSPAFVRQLKRSRNCPHNSNPAEPGTEELDELLGSYVIVSHDDAVNAMACYIAAWLSNVPEAQKMDPVELQKAVLQGVKVRLQRGWPRWRLPRLWHARVYHHVAR